MHPLLKELERDNDPHDVLEIAPGVVLAARAEPEFSTLTPGTSRAAEPIFQTKPGGAAATPALDATFRADGADHIKAPSDRSAAGTWARRLFIGILLSVCGAVAAAPWQHYSDAAKAMIANWAPSLVATWSPPATAAPSAQPDTPAVSPPDAQPAAATAAPAQPAALAQPAAAPTQPAAPAQPAQAIAPSALAPDQGPSLVSMAQQIEQLKASVEQLKAGQEQMSRDIARVSEVKASEVRPSEPNLRPRTAGPKMAAPLPRPSAGLTRKPRPTASAAPYLPPPQLPPIAAPAVAPQSVPETQATVETDGNPVVRPPLPVR
jgi:hypothetical protein